MNAPNAIMRGQPITADWLNQLREFAVRNRIVSGPGYKIKESSGGTALEIDKPKPAPIYTTPTSANPWQIFQYTPANWTEDACAPTHQRNHRVHLGYVNGRSCTDEVYCHEQNPLALADQAYDEAYDILCPASATTNIWGKVTYSRNPYCSQSAGGVTINGIQIQYATGTTWWTGYPAEYPSVGEFYFAIGSVTCRADSDYVQYTDCPGTSTPNPNYNTTPAVITQIATADQTIYSQPILFVTLTSDGGSAGDKNTACTYTYQATDLCGKVVGASLSPQNSRARILNAPTNTANKGTVYWDNAGILQLWDCNETLTQYSCPNTVGGGGA